MRLLSNLFFIYLTVYIDLSFTVNRKLLFIVPSTGAGNRTRCRGWSSLGFKFFAASKKRLLAGERRKMFLKGYTSKGEEEGGVPTTVEGDQPEEGGAGTQEGEAKPSTIKKKKSDPWTIHFNVLLVWKGTTEYTSVKDHFFVTLPQGSSTTINSFLATIQSRYTKVTINDLAPFDESILGQRVGKGAEGEWVATTKNPKPVNCKWNPSSSSSVQTIAEAGLNDGAEMALIEKGSG